MTRRRILSLWLPRLGAERVLRRERGLTGDYAPTDPAAPPFATTAEEKGALRLASLSAAAEASELRAGLALADARAVRPDLRSLPADPLAEEAFLGGLLRWAGRYAPWVGADGRDALALDITGCAHLFGGEEGLLQDMTGRLARMGLSARAAVADTKGAAWALARFAETEDRSPPIAAPGRTRESIGALPPAALRLDDAALDGLARLGLKSVTEIARLPRAALARRFGLETVRRLDQALGAEPEPVAPALPPPVYAARLSLPEPIGRTEDMAEGVARLLARLCARLEADRMGARRLRLSARRTDHRIERVEIGLARPSRDPARIAALFEKPIETLEADFGFDALRLQAILTEPLGLRQTHAGPDRAAPNGRSEALDDLLTRLGQRLGLERLTRLLPAESWIPEKSAIAAAAAFSAPPEKGEADWPSHAAARPERPLSAFAPEPIDLLVETASGGLASCRPPGRFRWRGAEHRLAAAQGPERIAPEWWLDDPAWRTGLRDYWRVETETGARIWLFHTPQSARAPCWFAAGLFA